MKFLFKNEAFSFETLRTTGFAAYGWADLGDARIFIQESLLRQRTRS